MTDLSRVCRTCMIKSSGLMSVFNTKYRSSESVLLSEMLLECAGIQITENDKLPKTICKECVKRVISSYEFRITCQQSERKLLQLSEDDFKFTETSTRTEPFLIQSETFPEQNTSDKTFLNKKYLRRDKGCYSNVEKLKRKTCDKSFDTNSDNAKRITKTHSTQSAASYYFVDVGANENSNFKSEITIKEEPTDKNQVEMTEESSTEDDCAANGTCEFEVASSADSSNCNSDADPDISECNNDPLTVKEETDDSSSVYTLQKLSDTKSIITVKKDLLTVKNEVSTDDAVKRNSKKTINRKTAYCYFCETLTTNFARHVKRKHGSEKEVQNIVSKPVKSKERKQLLAALRKKGNFIYLRNDCVIKPVKKSLMGSSTLPCEYCFGFYSAKQLWRHRRTCTENPDGNRGNQSISHNTLIKHLIKTDDKILLERVFPRMRPDQVSFTAKTDALICAYGARYLKMHREKHSLNVTSRKMRELAKLLIQVRKLNPEIKNLVHALAPQYYDLMVQATKTIANYDEKKDLYETPILALNMVTTLKQCCELAINFEWEKQQDVSDFQSEELKINLRNMIQLLDSKWKDDFRCQPVDDLNIEKLGEVHLIPLAMDLKLLLDYLGVKADNAASILTKENKNWDAYNELLETVFCQVQLLNGKKPVELQNLHIHTYCEQNDKELDQALSPTEKILTKNFKRVIIKEEGNRDVSFLFSVDVQQHIKILLKYRVNFIKNNPRLFFIPKKTTIHGCLVLSNYAEACGAKNPQAITSAKFRKHLATLCQLFQMHKNDFEQLATFMGLKINESCKLPDDVHQTAKIYKLLMLKEKGTDSEYEGKSLDEIELNEDLIERGISDEEQENPDDLSIDKTSRIEKVTRNNKRNLVPWTKQQKDIVTSFFKDHIKKKKPPKKSECEKLIQKYPKLLHNKSWLKIKVYVQNAYTKKYRNFNNYISLI